MLTLRVSDLFLYPLEAEPRIRDELNRLDIRVNAAPYTLELGEDNLGRTVAITVNLHFHEVPILGELLVHEALGGELPEGMGVAEVKVEVLHRASLRRAIDMLRRIRHVFAEAGGQRVRTEVQVMSARPLPRASEPAAVLRVYFAYGLRLRNYVRELYKIVFKSEKDTPPLTRLLSVGEREIVLPSGAYARCYGVEENMCQVAVIEDTARINRDLLKQLYDRAEELLRQHADKVEKVFEQPIYIYTYRKIYFQPK